MRRIGLGVFFGSVAVNAALGIAAVLAPNFGDTAVKVLLTSLCVTGAILTALCCEPAWERRLLWQVPAAGALLGCAAFGGLIAGLWTEPESETLGKLLGSTFVLAGACTLASVVVLERARKGISLAHERVITLLLGLIALAASVAVVLVWAPSSDTVGKLFGTVMVAAGGSVLAAFLTLPRPSRSGTRRVLNLTLGVIALAAAVAVTLIWTEPSGHTVGSFAGTCGVAAAACALAALLTLPRLAPAHEWVLAATLALLGLGAVLIVANIWVDAWGLTRAMGVVLIALAAFAVTVPVLHWLDRSVVAAAAAATDDTVRFCPHCGRKLAGKIDAELTCGRCRRKFTVSPHVST